MPEWTMSDGGAPGWYPDPYNPQSARWWTGESWSAFTEPAVAPQSSAPPDPPPASPLEPERVLADPVPPPMVAPQYTPASKDRIRAPVVEEKALRHPDCRPSCALVAIAAASNPETPKDEEIEAVALVPDTFGSTTVAPTTTPPTVAPVAPSTTVTLPPAALTTTPTIANPTTIPPAAAPTTTPPTNVPPTTALANPDDSRNCTDFASRSEAQRWFDTYFPKYGDVADLDSDDDGSACESL